MTRTGHAAIILLIVIIQVSFTTTAFSQEKPKPLISYDATPGELTGYTEDPNAMRPVIERFTVDLRDMDRIYEIPFSSERFERFRAFYTDWLEGLEDINFESMSQDGRIDYIVFDNFLRYRLRALTLEEERYREAEPLLPFAETVIGLQEDRRRMKAVDPETAADKLSRMQTTIEDLQKKLAEKHKAGEDEFAKSLYTRAANYAVRLQEILKGWLEYYNGYDPLFTWWCQSPYSNADKALAGYAEWLKQKPGGEEARQKEDVYGDPVGRDALVADLEMSMIPYTPEELLSIGEAEYDWCEQEMIRASRELGFGDEWLKAVEHVKSLHVAPGEQPELIKELAFEAIEFIESRDLMTIPILAKETWRMEMMSPERQLINPFFTGGPTITISFPTNTMEHDDKLMSLRGNNRHFARATVFHELIPGHHMQSYVNSRYQTHRRIFYTPFWTEGWALHWEMLLWDQGFPQSPENRIGMLFWRIHRCARIIFSLKFHMGQMTAAECIDFLVDRVGHERANAVAEVRRSFESYYGPIYQAAYMIGGLQFRAMHRELVNGGRMSNREFHDAIMRMNNMPVEMIRAKLTNQPLDREFKSSWKFYGEVPAKSQDK